MNVSFRMLTTLTATLTLLSSVACQTQPKATSSSAKAKKVQPALKQEVAPKKTTPPPKPQNPSKAVIEAAILAEKAMMEHVGMACISDAICPRYLRCVDKACAIPAAMTGKSTKTTPVVTFFKGKQARAKFFVELATDDEQRARGLMFRRSMKDDWGMLFIYPGDGRRSFWMRNTLIPLDMVFIRSDGVVLGVISNAEPLTTTPRNIGKDSRYILELNTGIAAKSGIVPGTTLTVTNVKDEHKPK